MTLLQNAAVCQRGDYESFKSSVVSSHVSLSFSIGFVGVLFWCLFNEVFKWHKSQAPEATLTVSDMMSFRT